MADDDKRLLFVFNPHAGRAQIQGQLAGIIDEMVKAGYEVVAYPTQGVGDAARKVELEAAAYGRIVCSGGDGTLDEVVTGLMRSGASIPLGYIPAGSTNDFAVSLGIPRDMARAGAVAVGGREFPCDVGMFNDDYFIYVAAFGLFTSVSYKTSQEWKNALGHAAYILEGVRSLVDIPSYSMEVEHDGDRIEDEFIYGMITNSTSIGGFKGMTGKDVRLDDGLFEVTLIRMPRNPLELNAIIASLANLVDNTDMIYSFKTSSIRCTSSAPIPWTLDGEFGGNQESVHIRDIPRAVPILVPAEGEE